MRYNENQVLLLIDNEPTLLACVVKLVRVTPSDQLPARLDDFCHNHAEILIPYRNQVGKDAFRREMRTFDQHPEERKQAFWVDAARYYTRKYEEGVDCQWALPDSWR